MSTNRGNVYAYEVTHSNIPTLAVGGCVVDGEDPGNEVRFWSTWNAETAEFAHGWTGKRRERICSPCYSGSPRHVRLHGHEGEHGPGEQYRPDWAKKP